MRRLIYAVVCVSSVLFVASVSAQPTVVTINGSPLTVIVGSDTSFQLVNSAFPLTGQIFPGGCINSVADAGVFAAISGTLYGPDFGTHPCGSAAILPTPWTPVSISPVTGTGTAADPFKVAVVVDAGATGVRLTATFSYVNGDGFYRLTKTFCSTTSTVSMNVYIGADIYLAGSDSGIPYLEPTSSSPGGKDCLATGYTILLVPTTPADRYAARGFGTIWSEISTQGDLSNIVDTAAGCIDNGAALEWKRTVTAGSCVTLTSASSFGAVPAITQFSVGGVTPNLGNPGQSMTVTVSGIGFQGGTAFTFGAGITVTSTSILSSSQALVNISISPTATPGPRDVTGTQQPAGLTSTAPGAFTVGGATTCPPAPVVSTPRSGATSGTIAWTGTADFFTIYFGQGRAGCSTPVGTTAGNSFRFGNLAPNSTYSFRVEANTVGCPTVGSNCVTFSTGVPCTGTAPTTIAPAGGAASVASPVTFKWSAEAGATSYTLYVSENQKPYRAVGPTTGTQITADVESGPISWFVVATFACGATARSNFSGFNATPGCGTPDAPVARAVALVRSNEKYHLLWNAVANADQYEYDVATSPTFNDAKTNTTSNLGVELSQTVAKATAFYFRVRAKNTACNTISPNSMTVRTVVVPEDSSTSFEFMLQAEFGTVTPISQQVLVRPPAGSLAIAAVTRFSATTDKPWLSVTPSTGTMPAEGVLLTITADPRGRPAGSSTGTLIVTTETSASATTPSTTVPISISLATPVTPTQTTKPSENSLIVPAVAHVDGLASTWRSDVRIANLGNAASSYRLLLSLTTGAGVTVNEASADVSPGKTLSLDDVVKNWFGFGPLGDGSNGVLEIRPADPAASRSLTAAVSKTYDVTPNGTLGQFIPAIPFGRFLGTTSSSLVVQPVTETPTYRTNFGFVEAAGSPANIVAKLFDATGRQLFAQTFAMKGGDQLQLSGLLAQQNITVSNGWLDVALESASGGKVTAYGSVVDNRTADGTLVIGVDPKEHASARFVVAGVGRASGSNWQSDVTLLNRGTEPIDATLTFSAQGSSDRPKATVHIDPQQVKVLDNVVGSLFNVQNALGSLIIDTPAAAPLVVEGRTYNDRPDGTVGQALAAFTLSDAVAPNGRALQILNIEESERYRSNLGLAEVTGQPATVEVTGYDAEALASPTITVQLAGNEFVQLSSILKQLGFERTYNGRVAVSVVGGTGAVAAYVSSVDNRTDDPTLVPAQ
ncbi:MAG TPA: hypothetical protein VLV78_10260 [Thermoanaerobaculia bacterium]|nr:hypothetical protein [Thermoanaerobaculia bacterium]